MGPGHPIYRISAKVRPAGHAGAEPEAIPAGCTPYCLRAPPIAKSTLNFCANQDAAFASGFESHELKNQPETLRTIEPRRGSRPDDRPRPVAPELRALQRACGRGRSYRRRRRPRELLPARRALLSAHARGRGAELTRDPRALNPASNPCRIGSHGRRTRLRRAGHIFVHRALAPVADFPGLAVYACRR